MVYDGDVRELERRAAERLPAHVYDYVRATAGGPEVLAEATAAWDAFRHRPRALRGGGGGGGGDLTAAPDTATTVLGTPVRTPVLVAPMAQQAAADPDGEAATAAGVADAIADVRRRAGLPVIVKGVLRGDDARRATEAGAAAVVVSTHGGRRLASAVPTAHVLEEVVAAVDDAAEVYVDSGLRSGLHVATALALGARAVFVGRPMMWALAAGGSTGVGELLGALTAELATAMELLGADALDELTRDLVR